MKFKTIIYNLKTFQYKIQRFIQDLIGTSIKENYTLHIPTIQDEFKRS